MTNTIQNIIHQAMVSQFMLEDVASQIIVKYNENSGGYSCSFVLGSKTAFMGELIIKRNTTHYCNNCVNI